MKTSLPFVPFVRANSDATHLEAFYADAPFCRVSLEKPKFAASVGEKYPLWIDIGFDGAPAAFLPKPTSDWVGYINKHGDLSCVANESFLKSPAKADLEKQIYGFLDEANALNPYFLSVPQLAQQDGIETNKINRLLAAIASDWKNNRKPSCRFILPVVFTNQRQLNKKTDRNAKISFIKSILAREGIDAVWATDATLEDQSGTGNFDKERFPGIVDFFKELNAACKIQTVITGPFWGLGLMLWARGVVTHFGIGLGSTYRYYIPGGMAHGAKARVAIGSLRRWVSSNPELPAWLSTAQGMLAAGSPEQKEMRDLEKHFPSLFTAELGKRQIARTYRQWLEKIISVPPAGRGVALFQDLSAAFVTGKALPPLPDEQGPARRPERVAEQLMVNCL